MWKCEFTDLQTEVTMPKPRKNESKRQYMNRCVPMVVKEGKTPKAAVGQCTGMWAEHKKDMIRGK